MGTSIYVYESMEEYGIHYNKMDQEVMFAAPIMNIYLKPDNKLWVVTKISKHKERPQFGRSIVHFINGSIEEHLDGLETMIKEKDIKYNPKNNNIEFFPSIGHSRLELRVDRYYGNKPQKKKELSNSKRFYDISRDRINLILQDGKPVQD